MNVEEYEEQRTLLVKQLNRIPGGPEWHRLSAKIDRLDDAFERELYGIRRARESPCHTLQSFGVV